MANQITNYKCPACTGPLHYVGESGKLECDYCGSSFSIEEMEEKYAGDNAKAEAAAMLEEEEREARNQAPVAPAQWETETAGDDWGRDAQGMRAYNCPSCGAELICEETTAATSCPYCGNPTILPGQFANAKKPDYIIPFKLDKNAAMEALKKHYRGKPLLPRAFSSENHIQEVKGVYVPFWLFDAKVHADVTFKTTRSFTHTTSKEIITTTDHFLVKRSGTIDIKRVPVDGAKKLPDGHMDAIEPFQYEEMKPFSLAYLPGFLADKYDVSKEESSRRADARCRQSALDAMEQTVLGYQTVVPMRQNYTIVPGDVKYALMPVWLLVTKWGGQDFLFAMNGQTGKLVGDLPVDKKKLLGFCAAAFAVATAALGWLFL